MSVLPRACRAVDAVAYRPFAARLGLARLWSCRLARLAGDPAADGHPPVLLPCHACLRRPATRVVRGGEGWLKRHEIELCEWCEVDPERVEHAEDLVRALVAARRRSVAWRWSRP